MALIHVRKRFLEATGRYDLVDSTSLANLGADDFINEGMRWLDYTFNIRQNFKHTFTSHPAGEWYASGHACRAIYAVYMSTTTQKWRLTQWDLEELISYFGGAYPGGMSRGLPQMYALHTRYAPESVVGSTIVDWWGTTLITSPVSEYKSNGIMWLPPLSETITLEIHGLYPNTKLTSDQQVNWWTEENPETLMLAACRALESRYRNTQGVRDYEDSIRSNMRGLEMDFIDNESAEVKQMTG